MESDMVVNHKPVASIMAPLGIHGLPRRRSRRRNLMNMVTSDLVNRDFTTMAANQLWIPPPPKIHHSSTRLHVRGLGCLLPQGSRLGDQ